MAIQTMALDPNAAAYTDDQIVGKVNAATAQITRASSIAAAARPIADNEVTEAKINTGAVSSGKLASGTAKANLDAMAAADRGYIKTDPSTGQFKVVGIQRAADGRLEADYDDVAV